MGVYLDASVIVATFVSEPHSARADFLFASNSDILTVSDFASAEFASAIGRRRRMGDLDAQRALTIFNAFDAWLHRGVEQIEIAPSDVNAAERLLRRPDLTLRTADAIHVAVAMRIDAMLATFDLKLAEAARVLKVQIAQI